MAGQDETVWTAQKISTKTKQNIDKSEYGAILQPLVSESWHDAQTTAE
jgi:hypothetical protein